MLTCGKPGKQEMIPLKEKRLSIDLDIEIFSRIKSIAALKNQTLKVMIARWLYDRLRTEESYLKPPRGE
ncbi:hypothetical protein LCGC14_0457100 [marine sediment metagenome]|uniref:Uncharacterized protein n=1 Tax=marine sediment metagenome TaxID=412755 RepID=A0A0F9VQ85_9ZZZZ